MYASDLVRGLIDYGIGFASGVPDSLLKPLINEIHSQGISTNITAANEGLAVAMGIGNYIATGKMPLIYMQNSGLGNALNPIISLAHRSVYDIPLLLIIGWRGEPGSDDEPQHMTQGKITKEMLKLLDFECLEINQATQVSNVIDFLTDKSKSFSNLKAVIVSAGTFTDHASKDNDISHQSSIELEQFPSREDALIHVLKVLPLDSVYFSTTGKLSRELYEHRKVSEHKKTDFLTVGGMGHASSISLAYACIEKSKHVVCLDGDGAALMHFGAIATIGYLKPQNYIHILFNNGTHESVGSQPVASPDLSYGVLSEYFGYPRSICLTSTPDYNVIPEFLKDGKGPYFIELKISSTSRNDLLRPSLTPKENLLKFINEQNF